MAIAYIAAIPYFLVVVDYPSVVDPLKKVLLLNHGFGGSTAGVAEAIAYTMSAQGAQASVRFTDITDLAPFGAVIVDSAITYKFALKRGVIISDLEPYHLCLEVHDSQPSPYPYNSQA
jgi:hypothetical protein